MAKLTEPQIKYRLNRALKDEKETKKKIETQKKKEREKLDKAWFDEQQKRKRAELEEFLPSRSKDIEAVTTGVENKEIVNVEKVDGGYMPPMVYDSVDLDEFINPVDTFKDRYGKDYLIYLDKYKAVKDKYQKIFDDINKKMYSDSLDENLSENSKTGEEYNNRSKQLKKIQEDFYMDSFNHFQEFVPIYNKYVCTCCGKQYEVEDFYINYDYTNLSKIDAYGNVRIHVCKDCCEKLFNFYFSERADRDPEKAMKMFCASLNIYWDIKLYKEAMQNMINNLNSHHITYEYFEVINRNENSMGKTFLESPFLDDKYVSDMKRGIEGLTEEEQKRLSIDDINNAELINWSKDDLRNRRQVLKMVGYDPFDYETSENRKQLYSDLLGMIEPGMEQDNVKVQAAIQICTSFLKIREMNKQYREMQKADATINELKTLADLKQKELTSISKFSQDNGFSERYGAAKAKGENTFTGILNKMNEDKFEDAILNRYDVSTSATIQQAADASIKAIFAQLSYSDSEAFKTVADQLAEINKLRKELDETKESLRKTRYELRKKELEDQARKAGIYIDEDYDSSLDGMFLEDIK